MITTTGRQTDRQTTTKGNGLPKVRRLSRLTEVTDEMLEKSDDEDDTDAPLLVWSSTTDLTQKS